MKGLGLIALLLLVGSWYVYTRYLSEIHHNFDFKLSASFPYPLAIIPQVVKRVFIQWLPELYVNYAQFFFVTVALFSLRKVKEDFLIVFMRFYAMGLAVYIVVMLPMLEMHDYYMIPALPLLIVLATLGFKETLHWPARNPKFSMLIILLLFLVPVLGSVRALSRFEGATIEPELLTIEKHLDQVIPDKRQLIIAASDDSPSIYLYFMHRKGWSITEEITGSTFEESIVKGAKYLVSDSRQLEERREIARHLTKISTHGRFNVFQLAQ